MYVFDTLTVHYRIVQLSLNGHFHGPWTAFTGSRKNAYGPTLHSLYMQKGHPL